MRVLPPAFLISLLCFSSFCGGAAAAQTEEKNTVARWEFEAEEATPLTPHGDILRDQAGPRAPEFPDFSATNTAVRFNGQGTYFSIPDSGPNSSFDFSNGEAITLEAWVKMDAGQLRENLPMNVIGKGRTGSPRFARDNQNWALRVVTSGGETKIGFLFASAPQTGDKHWHRWTSKQGFAPITGWHHIAVSYRFGEPASIRGWIDGQPTTGTWDMGGASKEAPVVDDDEVRIGTSLNGWLDAIAVHRAILDDATLAGRFKRLGGPRVVGPLPEVMPEIAEVPAGRVKVILSEKLPAHDRWLNEGETWPKPALQWESHSFLFPRLPVRYDDWGIRTSWQAPVLVQLAADVELPVGQQKFLLRVRGMSRLWIDGQLVARTEASKKRPPDGEEPMTPVAEPPLPGARRAGYRQQEMETEFEILPSADQAPTKRCRVVLELAAGGQNLRTETGEVCLAILAPDGKSFEILQPFSNSRLPLTDEAVNAELEQMEVALTTLEDRTRRQQAASQAAFWKQRHVVAREWGTKHPAPEPPQLTEGQSAHPIDRFITAKIEQALNAAAQTDAAQAEQFHTEILPLLRDNCFRCHGEKDNGGLKLNSREQLLRGGDSDIPAVVPGKPAESELIARITSEDESLKMPPTGHGLTPAQISQLEAWIEQGASWPAAPLTPELVAVTPIVNDEAFLRRAYLDTLGLPPSAETVRNFLADNTPDKRNQLVEQLLNDERCADHWMSEWLDLLAENPTLLNASLNSTGPFRWFLHESFRDKKPFDQLVTELLLMRGSSAEGGSAGFAIAAENDSPFAAKGHIVAATFLGIELQCARCHDSPYHRTTQRDLYSLAAMLNRKSVTVPKTSRVPAAFFEKKARESLIQVTLKPDEEITPVWPFAEETGVVDNSEIDALLRQKGDSRERLAALITSPQNQRFSRVIVNRVWQQLIGAGLVEPASDWEGQAASHPQLLDWLAHQFVTHDYDLRHVMRLIMTSQLYQREASGQNLAATAELRFFNAPERRRLTAEQIVDSLHAATGKAMQVEELTFVHDGRRPLGSRLTLGVPSRAWMLADLKNERDRPSLSLPYARTITDVLEAFGWTGSRQKPILERETDPNVLQPGVLANGTLVMNLIRASHQSELADLAVQAESPEELVETIFLRVLSRRPNPQELTQFSAALQEGFDARLVPAAQVVAPAPPEQLPLVTWFNHLQSDANLIQQEHERRVRQGPPADPRLNPEWRAVYEDQIWSLINHREFVWVP